MSSLWLAPHSCGPFWRGKFLGIGDVLACDIRRPNQWSGVSPFKGRWTDEIPDAEYKVVEHQIAPPLDPCSRWRFQRLVRGTGSGLDDASYAELVNACRRKTVGTYLAEAKACMTSTMLRAPIRHLQKLG